MPKPSYKHPILEYIFIEKTQNLTDFPTEILITYDDINRAMEMLGQQRPKQASISNFVIDLTRRRNLIEQRVSALIIQHGYDLDRAADRVIRQGIVGRLVKKSLKTSLWFEWPQQTTMTIVIQNRVPHEVLDYLGKDEGALLSVMDYCDVLSLALNGESETIKRVQHPKKWQPGEVDGLYTGRKNTLPILYPVEAKALSTGDDINLAQISSAYRTIRQKIKDVEIIPVAAQMTSTGILIAEFGQIISEVDFNVNVTRTVTVILDVPILTWQKNKR